MKHADYEIVRVEEDRVFIVDLDLDGKSVTNDSDFVYEEVQKVFPGKRVIYRDTMGKWDEIVEFKGIKKYMLITETEIIPYQDHVPNPDEITGFPSSEFIRSESSKKINKFPHNKLDASVFYKNVKDNKKYYK